MASKFNIPRVSSANNPSSSVIACTPQDATIDGNGERNSTDKAFLPKSLATLRKNLTICTRAIVTSLDIRRAEDGQLRVVGINFDSDAAPAKYEHEKAPCSASASREVILCAGAIMSPQLLLLRYAHSYGVSCIVLNDRCSGIGPRKHLEEFGIPVLKDLSGVGEHLVSFQTVSKKISLVILEIAGPHQCTFTV